MDNLKKVFDKVVQDKIRTIPGKAKTIETAKSKGRILAVKGSYDYVERVLPYCYAAEKVVIGRHDPVPDCERFDVLFVGCPGKLSLKHWQPAITAFLAGGGVLLTTDWCLNNLTAKLFPAMIRREGDASGTYSLHVVTPSHPVVAGIPKCEGTPWVVEAASHRIRILDQKNVTTILEAPSMGEPSAVLVAFDVGPGLVVHAISHFHLQGSAESGEYVSAFILTNVIDEAVRRRHSHPPRIRVAPSKGLRIKVLNK